MSNVQAPLEQKKGTLPEGQTTSPPKDAVIGENLWLRGKTIAALAVLASVVLVAVVYVAILGGLFAAMHQPPAVFGRVMSKVPDLAFMVFPFKQLWFVARKGHLNTGDQAPDFSLQTADRKARVQLSAFRGQEPVVLVFGSHT